MTENKLVRILKSRLEKARNLIKKYGDLWLVISSGISDTNIDYLLGLHAHGLMGALLYEEGLHIFIGRLERSFIGHLEDILVRESEIHTFYGYDEFEREIKKILAEYSGRRILANFSASELYPHASSLSYALTKKIMHFAEIYEIELRPAGRFVYELRQTKTPEELEALRNCVKLTMNIFDSIVNEGVIKPGMTEREIAAKFYGEIYKIGEPSFDIIVASGPNTANPHHVVSERKLETNDILYIDFGVRYLTMCSDITRCLVIGSPSNKIKMTYNAVVEAQNEAISTIKVGATFSEPDIAARKTFQRHGFDPEKYFIHTLGHALGIDVHDVGPTLSYKVVNKRIPGNVAYTVEPALYFEKEFGIRLEDDVIVLDSGIERLVKAPEEPIYL
ncbi:MAG: Xaa-Pro peptidase family protein [Crenarchaeota archaeon]|nr:Xaa-Pro peptidase family protein [Thermoproteota archaeon]MCR8455020.1 Xaa-Pro peptidase family protein [Thermoproteota archaeon]MCR8463258.1 Xaa-Pro peptidase family protein [Thermoproteota archaeon]MCR8471485.1 Xaa-Pro peptidase family protein [Thermoproteota archaeon]MCR8473380.1 Xaa-Pro peptidase family protein [Thermoproteota archaeon]